MRKTGWCYWLNKHKFQYSFDNADQFHPRWYQKQVLIVRFRVQCVRICQLSNSCSEFILWTNRGHHITSVSPTVAAVSTVSSAAINFIHWPESGSLDHQGSVGVNTTSTGALDHQKEEAMLDASRLACQHHRLILHYLKRHILLTISIHFWLFWAKCYIMHL